MEICFDSIPYKLPIQNDTDEIWASIVTNEALNSVSAELNNMYEKLRIVSDEEFEVFDAKALQPLADLEFLRDVLSDIKAQYSLSYLKPKEEFAVMIPQSTAEADLEFLKSVLPAEINNMLKEVGTASRKEKKTLPVIEANLLQSSLELVRVVLSDMEQEISDENSVKRVGDLDKQVSEKAVCEEKFEVADAKRNSVYQELKSLHSVLQVLSLNQSTAATTPTTPVITKSKRVTTPETTPTITAPTTVEPVTTIPTVLKSDDNNLHAWMRKRGFEVYTDSLMSIGVETVDDLSLVWHEDLTELKIDDEMATKISLEIQSINSMN